MWSSDWKWALEGPVAAEGGPAEGGVVDPAGVGVVEVCPAEVTATGVGVADPEPAERGVSAGVGVADPAEMGVAAVEPDQSQAAQMACDQTREWC